MTATCEYQVSLHKTPDDLTALGNDWSGLYQSSNGFPFSSYDWAMAWRSHLCPPSEPFVIAARTGSDLAGILPLRLESRRGFRVIRFMSDGRADYLGPLLASGHEAAESVLMDSLCRFSGEWDVAILRNCTEFSRDLTSLSLPAEVVPVCTEIAQAPYLSFSGNWDDLLVSGPSELRRAKRKLSRFARADGKIERYSGSDLAARAQDIQTVESRSWKAGTGAARFQTEAEFRMLEALLASSTLQDEIDIWIARIGSRPVAYLLNFRREGRTCYYQGAYDQEYASHSPGTLLHYRAIEQTWRQGGKEYDFMMGNEAWKLKWTNGNRSLQQLVLYPKTLRGVVAYLALAAPKNVARRLRRTLQSG